MLQWGSTTNGWKPILGVLSGETGRAPGILVFGFKGWIAEDLENHLYHGGVRPRFVIST